MDREMGALAGSFSFLRSSDGLEVMRTGVRSTIGSDGGDDV
jgi:hypothetical protein